MQPFLSLKLKTYRFKIYEAHIQQPQPKQKKSKMKKKANGEENTTHAHAAGHTAPTHIYMCCTHNIPSTAEPDFLLPLESDVDYWVIGNMFCRKKERLFNKTKKANLISVV